MLLNFCGSQLYLPQLDMSFTGLFSAHCIFTVSFRMSSSSKSSYSTSKSSDEGNSSCSFDSNMGSSRLDGTSDGRVSHYGRAKSAKVGSTDLQKVGLLLLAKVETAHIS